MSTKIAISKALKQDTDLIAELFCTTFIETYGDFFPEMLIQSYLKEYGSPAEIRNQLQNKNIHLFIVLKYQNQLFQC